MENKGYALVPMEEINWDWNYAEGRTISLRRTVRVDWDHPSSAARLACALALTAEQADQRLHEHVEQERALISQIDELLHQWAGVAAETQALQEARNYLASPPAEHTNNQWVTDQDGVEYISNTVYEMRVRRETGTRSGKPACYVTWRLSLNLPPSKRNEYRFSQPHVLAEQRRRSFVSEVQLEEYISQVKERYADLFRELSPPVNREDTGPLCVRGVLPPSYRLTGRKIERTPEPD